jgi:hypothetical protein
MGQPPEQSKPEEQKDEAAANPPQQPASDPNAEATAATPASGETAQAPDGAGASDAAGQTGDNAATSGETTDNASVHDEHGAAGAAGGADTTIAGVQGVVASLLPCDKFDAIPPDHTSISVCTTSSTGVKTEEHFSWNSENAEQVKLANEKFAALRSDGYIVTLLDKEAKIGGGGTVVTELQSKPNYHYEARKTLTAG